MTESANLSSQFRMRNLLSLPVIRPVAISMVFLSILLLGYVGIGRMPVELLPSLEGKDVYISFSRQGSTPEVVEREILIPLTSRVSALGGVTETHASINGSSGNMMVKFHPLTDVKKREYEITQIANSIQRTAEERTTYLNVARFSISGQTIPVMSIHVIGEGRDANELYDLTADHISPRLASVPGVAEAQTSGGGLLQVWITVDPDMSAALGVTARDIVTAINRQLGRTQFAGSLEESDGRVSVIVEGQVDSIGVINRTQIVRGLPLTIEDVATIEVGYGVNERRFRYNGKPAVGIQIFQEQGSNLVDVGNAVEARIEEVRDLARNLGIELRLGENYAENLEHQIQRLYRLGLIGLGIALVVLFLFLRQVRAVLVVGIAVPVSVTAALASLYLMGQTINILTLFGLAMAIGLLVDNSVVVYEAILRGIERGLSSSEAARVGLRKTLRAIVASSLTTAIIFVPIFVVGIEDAFAQQLMSVLAASIVVPVFASLVVAIGLVPLLAHRLAAPAALRRIQQRGIVRESKGGHVPPDRAKMLLGGFASSAMRSPASWVVGTLFLIFATLIYFFISQISFRTSQTDADRVDSINVNVQLAQRFNLNIEDVTAKAAGVEEIILGLEDIDNVQTVLSLENVNFQVEFVDWKERSEDFSVATIRQTVSQAAESYGMSDRWRSGYRGGWGGGQTSDLQGSIFGDGLELKVSGPESSKLLTIAEDIARRLQNLEDVRQARLPIESGRPEIWVTPKREALEAYGLTSAEAVSYLDLAGRDGERATTNFALPNEREIPVVVEREGARDESVSRRELMELTVQTSRGVMPITEIAEFSQMPPPTQIVHVNGRREMTVQYQLERHVPESGRERNEIIDQIQDYVRSIPLPSGYVVDIPQQEQQVNWAKRLVLPVLGLLFLVLAFTFESLALPVLVFLSIPLVIVGSLWALSFTGTPVDSMVIAGFFVLAGLTVNPSILLLDRMQQFSRAGFSRGAAAYAAVKERTRPVLLTTATTVAALFPLAITTGRENELWPPFAIVVMGGLISGAFLTLIVAPVGYLSLKRVDEAFGRLGPWLMIVWVVAVVGTMYVLFTYAGLNAFLWQIICTVLIGAVYFAILLFAFRPRERIEPDTSKGPPELKVTSLRKIYGLPGTLKRVLKAQKDYAAKVMASGGVAFSPTETVERSLVLLILAAACGVIAWFIGIAGWMMLLWMVGAGFLVRICIEIRKFRGHVNEDGTHKRGGIEGILAVLIPWIVIGVFVFINYYQPKYMLDEPIKANLFWPIVASILLLLGQLIRRSAVRQQSGLLSERVTRGFMKYPRTWYRRFSRRLGGFDITANEIHALSSVTFSVKRGMVGILGPNGAGKTTLLRQLAGIIDSTRGNIRLGDVNLRSVRQILARWVGYLPQDAGLPRNLSCEEYLLYYAALYEISPEEQKQRVSVLLKEVGLGDKMTDRIGSLSGGMRQRVAVARTLLRLPPIIIVDEPTVGLDPRERIRFRNLLSKLAETRIVLFSTHVVEDVAISCDRVLVIAKSKLRFDGSPSELAQSAEGKVWEFETLHEGAAELPDKAILAEEAPTADGKRRQRVVHETAPSINAQQVTPRPEDGYLWLLAQVES